MKLEIQELRPSDWQRFKKIRLLSLQDAPDAFGGMHDEEASRPDASWQAQLSKMPTFLGTLNDQDVGVVRLGFDKDDPSTGWLLSMWVAPGARGHSVGDQLVGAVLNLARTSELRRVLLDVGAQNIHASKLYARNGFTPTGVTGCLPPPREHIEELQMSITLIPS